MRETTSCPIVNSDHIGADFISKSKTNQESLGQYFTPVEVANYMASMLSIPLARNIKILDPGAGSGILAASSIKFLIENDPKSTGKTYEAYLYEIDKAVIPFLTKSMKHLQKWCLERNISFEFTVINKDYILENASVLDDEPSLFKKEMFDVVISNPPYFKVSKDDMRAIACDKVVYGQPNIYSLFMAVSAAQLNAGGQFLFITPRSFSSGQYFKAFRKFLFENISLEKIHVFGSRTDAFNRDAVLQENIICYGKRTQEHSDCRITILSSSGKHDLQSSKSFTLPSAEVLDKKNDWSLALPANRDDAQLLKSIKSWNNSLEKMSLKISTGPVVPFRATEHLHAKKLKTSVPLLWIQHVHPMTAKFPLEFFRKEQWIEQSVSSKKLLVENQNMILMRRFSPKEEFRRLTVAAYVKNDLDFKYLGLENHLNYIYSKEKILPLEELFGLTAFLNSKIFDSFFRITNGNTQVSATELRSAPLPDKKSLIEIGKMILKSKHQIHSEIDIIVNEVLEIETD